jgi:hypothetical protein
LRVEHGVASARWRISTTTGLVGRDPRRRSPHCLPARSALTPYCRRGRMKIR